MNIEQKLRDCIGKKLCDLQGDVRGVPVNDETAGLVMDALHRHVASLPPPIRAMPVTEEDVRLRRIRFQRAPQPVTLEITLRFDADPEVTP